jgi:transposase
MDTSGKISEVAALPKRGWRRHSDDFKARAVQQARLPNVSMAAVALANGLNANMLRRWVREAEISEARTTGDQGLPAFVQLPFHAVPAAPTPEPEHRAERVDVEIHRNGSTLRANLPMDSRSAAWLREVTG